MTRHELKDGKWYLIKHEKSFLLGPWEEENGWWNIGEGEVLRLYYGDEKTEWVEIDPGLVFEMFKETK